MPHLTIENCHITISGTQLALGCNCGGARYHVWLDTHLKPQPPLYKNPLAAILLGQPGYFNPRKLTRTSKFASALIQGMLSCMKRDNLLEKARAEEAAQQAQEAQRARDAQLHCLIVGADPRGRLYFYNGDGQMNISIHKAAVFPEGRVPDAQALIESPATIRRRHFSSVLTVLMVPAGHLMALGATL
jgi:hypothetical protein